MKILTRYVLGQFLGTLLLTVAVVAVVMIPSLLVQKALDEGLGVAQVLRIMPYIVPEAMRYTVPAAMLFAACIVFGRFAGNNELVAVKAAGISPGAILWPVLAASILLSLSLVYLNDIALSWGRTGIRRVIIDSIEEMAYGALRTHRSFASKKFSISVRRVEDRRLLQPTISFQGSDPTEEAVTIQAEWAELRADPVADTLTIMLHNGRVMSGPVRAVFPGTVERVLPLSDSSGQSLASQRAADLPLHRLPEETRGKLQQIEHLEQDLVARAAFQILTGQVERLADRRFTSAQSRLDVERSQLARLRTEPHRRWADGFSCLCFVMVGIPLAIRRRNSDFLTSFFWVFLPVVVVYYPFLMLGLNQAKAGELPSYTVWVGNVTFFLAGLHLMRHVWRY